MKRLSREKLAILFFMFLILFGLGISLFYISSLSTPLNVAASNIDDAAGNLEDYSAIVYEGLAEEAPANAQSNSGKEEPSEELNKRSQNVGDNSTDELTASEALPDSAADEEEKAVVTLFDTKKSYVEKGASVFELNVASPSEYKTRSVVRAGKYTFGILSVDEQTASSAAEREKYIQKRVKEYENIKIDFVILVVSDLDLLMSESVASSDGSSDTSADQNKTASSNQSTQDAQEEQTSKTASSDSSDSTKAQSTADAKSTKKQIALKGVDIVISTKNEGLNAGGVMVDGIFYNDAPLKHEVGTLLISPSKVISAKDVK